MQATEIMKDGVAAVRGALGGLRRDVQPEASGGQEGTGEKAATNAAAVKDDPIALLTMQHREVDALFAEIEGAGDKAVKTKEKLVATLNEKLQLHARIEEKIFYPAVKEIDESLVLESYEEHEALKHALKRLVAASAKDESFDAKVTVLKEIIQHHVKEEENELFPKVKRQADDEALAKLFARMQAVTEREEQAGRPRAKKARTQRRAAPRKAAKAKTGGAGKRAPAARKARSPRAAQRRSSRG